MDNRISEPLQVFHFRCLWSTGGQAALYGIGVERQQRTMGSVQHDQARRHRGYKPIERTCASSFTDDDGRASRLAFLVPRIDLERCHGEC